MDWLTESKIPLGVWMSDFVDWLNEHAAIVFYTISDVLGFLIEGLIDILLWFNPLVLIALVAGIAWVVHRKWRLVVLIVLSFLLIVNLGYWEATMETLALVLFATGLCMVIGVPVGIAAAHRSWLYQGLRPILDLMQTIPTFVYLIPTLILFGLGVVPGLISTVIFAIAAPVRLTYLGVSSTPGN